MRLLLVCSRPAVSTMQKVPAAGAGGLPGVEGHRGGVGTGVARDELEFEARAPRS
jgi:hypothetical protein